MASGVEINEKQKTERGEVMRKQLLVLLLCLSLAGLPACAGYSSRYGPSLFELASARAIPVTTDGKLVQPKIVISDQDIMTRAESVQRVWEKRDQRVRGLGIGTALSQVGLGFLPTVLGLFLDITPIGPIINAASTLLGKFIEVINPDERVQAYADGIKMLVDAKNEYLDKQRDDIAQDKVTDAGRVLAKKTDYAIIVVENTLSGKVSSLSEVSGATISK